MVPLAQHPNQQAPAHMQQHTLRLSRRSIWLTALSFDTLTTMAVTVGPKAAEIASGVVAVSSSVSCSRAAMTAISCLQQHRWYSHGQRKPIIHMQHKVRTHCGSDRVSHALQHVLSSRCAAADTTGRKHARADMKLFQHMHART